MPLEGNVDETITGMWTFDNDIKLNNNHKIIDLGLPLILAEDPLNGGFTIDCEDASGISFRTGANFIGSPAPGVLEIKSPKLFIKDGFTVEMPTAGNHAWVTRIDTLGQTGVRFNATTSSLEFVNADVALAGVSLGSGDLRTKGTLDLIGKAVKPLSGEAVSGSIEIKVSGQTIKLAVLS